jgi:hypothetical protein
LPLVSALYDIETLLTHSSDAFDSYKSGTGATLDNSTGLLKISSDQYNQLSSLFFTIGEESYELTPNAQIWPRSLNSAINGTTDGIYLIVNDIGTQSGSGLDVINGYCFLYAALHFLLSVELLNRSFSESVFTQYSTQPTPELGSPRLTIPMLQQINHSPSRRSHTQGRIIIPTRTFVAYRTIRYLHISPRSFDPVDITYESHSRTTHH